jgi:hypothetical protein
MGLPDLSGPCRATIERAGRFAAHQQRSTVTPTDLLLAISAEPDGHLPELIVERGGLSFRRALRRAAYRNPRGMSGLVPAPPPSYRGSMSQTVVILFLAPVVLIASFRRRRSVSQTPPRLDRGATVILALARQLSVAGPSRAGRETVTPAHLLLAVASSPGPHLRLFDNPSLMACALRRELGLSAWHHDLVLALDGVKLRARRIKMRLDRRVSEHGRISRWGLAWAAYALAGLLGAALVFPITVLANILLYLFLWPATILNAGIRALCGLAAGCETTNHRLHEVPGGELALAGAEGHVSDRRLLTAFLLPRLLAFLISTIVLVVVIWRSQRLGVTVFPTVFARPDLVTQSEALWEVPLAMFGDTLDQHGALGGIGILAGLGLAFMSIPTYSELSLIRLYGGHELGRGSGLIRAITLPAAILTGVVACIEAVLPFRNGPIYLTVYVVPAIFSLLIAGALVSFAPY